MQKPYVVEDLAGSYEYYTPDNWYNAEENTSGILKANGSTEDDANRFYTGFIPVSPGDIVRHYVAVNHNKTYRYNIACYDSNKTVIPLAGSNVASISDYEVPQGISYIRLTFSVNVISMLILTINLVPTDWTIQYFNPYCVLIKDMVTEESQKAIENAKELNKSIVKGTNLVTSDNTFIGSCYYSGGIKYNTDDVTYSYVVVNIKQNTRYFVNVNCRFYIFTDDNDNMISNGNTSLGKLYFDSGEATKLYYTIPKLYLNTGLIIAEGYSGTLTNSAKPDFVQGLNQLMHDSWFAVALTPGTIRFTVGISEKLYYYNILALEKNIIDLSIGGTKETDGILVTPSSAVTESNTYGYTVYDDNLSIVANAPRGGVNRLTIAPDNVQNCSALIIGDSITARNNGAIGQTLIDAFTQRGKTITLLGTLGSGDNKHEGRPGWTAGQYFTDKQYEGVTNPFYNPVKNTFDFEYYMTNSGYSSVDFVVIHLGGNDLFSFAFSESRERINLTENNICAMIDSILEWNPNQKIIIELAPTTSPDWQRMSAVGGNPILIRAKFNTYNAEMLVILTKYKSNVRCSNDYMIINPNDELQDHIHPTNAGLAKIGMELFSQINCWQNNL